MKIVLAGSPEISVQAFENIINNFHVVAIVTQPDKPRGRGMKTSPTPVAILGAKHNIKVFKPHKIGQIKDDLVALDFDLFLSFAFGQYVPSSILNLGTYKPLNIHGSLLPKYRGAAPIHYAILNQDQEIGITLMEMTKEMDAGNMLFKASAKIESHTTTGQAFDIISDLAADNIVQWLNKVKSKTAPSTPQGPSFSLAPKITKEFCELLSTMTKAQALAKIKGLNPFPGAYMILASERIKIFNAQTTFLKNALKLEFKDGTLYAYDYQRPSKKRINLKK